MDESVVGGQVPGDAERDEAVRLVRRRMLEQVAALAARAPGHRLTVETWPGRGDRFVAQAITPTARPYLVVTGDLDELSAELACPSATTATSSPATTKTSSPIIAGTGDEKP